MESVLDLTVRLAALEPCKWPVHEAHLAEMLGLTALAALCVAAQLTVLVAALRKGYTGSKRAGTLVSTGVATMDLRDEGVPNSLNVHFSKYGEPENFPTATLNASPTAPRQPRHFLLGSDTVPTAISADPDDEPFMPRVC